MNSCSLFSLATDTFQVGSEECIHACDADDHNLGLDLAHLADFLYCLRYIGEVTPCDQIGFAHLEEEHPVAVAALIRENRGVTAAACRCNDQHHRFRYHESCPLDAEALRAGRIICQRRR